MRIAGQCIEKAWSPAQLLFGEFLSGALRDPYTPHKLSRPPNIPLDRIDRDVAYECQFGGHESAFLLHTGRCDQESASSEEDRSNEVFLTPVDLTKVESGTTVTIAMGTTNGHRWWRGLHKWRCHRESIRLAWKASNTRQTFLHKCLSKQQCC